MVFSPFRAAPLLAFLFLLCSTVAFAQNAKTPMAPGAFLPHQLGEQFTPHHLLTDYFEHLAATAPTTMKLERYGNTSEARPLQLAFFASPENLARLESIRINNLRLAGLGDGKPGDLTNAPAIVWLSMSVHGNESAGSECSMELAYRLATQTDPQIKAWLRNTVVIVDPSVNPDGYDRYTHWSRMVSNLRPNLNRDTREHEEPWPSGRVNHYYFDLNRDWAWATQTETRQRIAIYQRWLPHIHPDIHEQGIDNPYYFAPAAEPMHDYITPWQREFQNQIGKNHARYFDEHGWLYFTKEVFDLFYPSYGDTYPMFNGAIGMTYEQAGIGAGRAVSTLTGDTLKLSDRIMHHLTTSLSTIEMTSQHAQQVVENFRDYYTHSVSTAPGQYGSFVVKATNDPNKINQLCKLMDLHKIRYGLAGASASGIRAYDYSSSKEATVTIDPKDIVISVYQPHGVLASVLFEPYPRLSDSLTYDITGWSLLMSYGLDAYALKQRLEPKKGFEPYKAPDALLSAVPYSWCIHRKSLADARCIADLLDKGVHIRYAREAFAMSDQQFEPGTFVINRGDNQDIEDDFDAIIRLSAAKNNVTLHPLLTGYAGKGHDMGSESFVLINKPEIAMVYGEGVDENSFGHTWFFFEKELGYPVSMLPLEKLQHLALHDYSILIFPNGDYNFDEKTLKMLQEWVRNGGRIIGFEGGARAFADKDGFDLKAKTDPKKDSAAMNKPLPYQMSERDRISDQLPGAIVKAQIDPSHPLAYGLGTSYFSLKTGTDAYDMPAKATSAVWLGETYETFGFVGTRVIPKLKNSPIATLQRMGEGNVVLMIDNPLFRSFWEEGKRLFANALLF